MDPVGSGLDPTTPLEQYANSTVATGGDSRLYNLNVFYNVSVANAVCRNSVALMVASPAISLGCSHPLPSCCS